MATNGQFYWPSVGSSVAAYGQFGMAANRTTVQLTWQVLDGGEIARGADPVVVSRPMRTASQAVRPVWLIASGRERMVRRKHARFIAAQRNSGCIPATEGFSRAGLQSTGCGLAPLGASFSSASAPIAVHVGVQREMLDNHRVG